MVQPITTAWRRAGRSLPPTRSMRPRKPPAKLSPAPVGSTTPVSGKAGAKNASLPETSSAPYSPRLMQTARAPIFSIAAAAFITLDSPASWRASASLTISTSTRGRSSRSFSRFDEIQ